MVMKKKILKELVKELDLGSQVMFFKDIGDDLKNALIAKSNIFVMPSIIHKNLLRVLELLMLKLHNMVLHLLEEKMVVHLMQFSHDKTGLICDGNNLDDIYSSLNSMIENKKYLNLEKMLKNYLLNLIGLVQ